jgi:hypothetical protein
LEPLEGATFSGGEPMQQAEGLLELDESDPQDRPSGEPWDVHGYTESELASGRFVTRLGADGEQKCELWRAGSGTSGLRGDWPLLRSDPTGNCAAADESKSKTRSRDKRQISRVN